jgi:3-hydroxyacyl-[acyl-carrier-protein] dehydratase
VPPLAVREPAGDGVTVTDAAVVTRAVVDPAGEVFAGHYPGFPILPGVLLVDAVGRAAARWGEAHRLGRLRLAEVRSARFLAPVFPGDELTTDCTVARVDPGLVEVRGVCSTARGRAARITVRCAVPEPA